MQGVPCMTNAVPQSVAGAILRNCNLRLAHLRVSDANEHYRTSGTPLNAINLFNWHSAVKQAKNKRTNITGDQWQIWTGENMNTEGTATDKKGGLRKSQSHGGEWRESEEPATAEIELDTACTVYLCIFLLRFINMCTKYW